MFYQLTMIIQNHYVIFGKSSLYSEICTSDSLSVHFGVPRLYKLHCIYEIALIYFSLGYLSWKQIWWFKVVYKVLYKVEKASPYWLYCISICESKLLSQAWRFLFLQPECVGHQNAHVALDLLVQTKTAYFRNIIPMKHMCNGTVYQRARPDFRTKHRPSLKSLKQGHLLLVNIHHNMYHQDPIFVSPRITKQDPIICHYV